MSIARKKGSKKVALVGIVLLSCICLMVCTSCMPRELPKETNKAANNEIVVKWDSAMSCAGCHKSEEASQQNDSCLAYKHANQKCETCHGDPINLEKIHDDVTTLDTLPTKLNKENAIDEQTCLECHGSWEELAVKTADSKVFTDENATVINPHAISRTGDHSFLTCTSCHTEHEEQSDQKELCLSCHHENVFECHTCHE